MIRAACYWWVFLLLACAQGSYAMDLCCGSLGQDLNCTQKVAVPLSCPNDYCRKPAPCVPCPVQTKCACYCRKPAPCPPCCCPLCCCDCYCRKPLPQCCWPVCCQYYKCPPRCADCCRGAMPYEDACSDMSWPFLPANGRNLADRMTTDAPLDSHRSN